MKNLALILLFLFCGVALADGPLSFQGPTNAQVLTTGYIDPTVSTYNGSKPMQCTASTIPGSTFTEQNRATLQQAISDSSSTGKPVRIPPCAVDVLNANAVCPANDTCGYPFSRKAAALIGVDFSGLSNVTIFAYGAVLRMAGETAGNDFYGLSIRNSSHDKIFGATFSQRDVFCATKCTGTVPNTNTLEQTHSIRIGDTSNSADDVELVSLRFIEGINGGPTGGGTGGDCINVLGALTHVNTRIGVYNSTFISCLRSSFGTQRGFYGINIVENRFVNHGGGDMIHYEPTSDAPIGGMLATLNLFDGTNQSGAQANLISGNSDKAYSTVNMIDRNVFVESQPGESLNVTQTWWKRNIIKLNNAVDGNPTIWLLRRAFDIWVVGNSFYRGPAMPTNPIVYIESQQSNCGTGLLDCKPHDVQVRDNFVDQFDPSSSPAIRFDSLQGYWAVGNDITYHGTGSDSGGTGFYGLTVTRTDGEASGFFSDNEIVHGVQADGSSSAGLPSGAMSFSSAGSGSGDTVGYTVIRDNRTEGSFAAGVFSTALVGVMPDGPPVISGNFFTSTTVAQIRSLAAYRTESMLDAETLVGAGALSLTKHSSYITTVAAYTLADNYEDGFIKTIVFPATLSSATTVTIAHLAEGSAIQSTASNGGSFRVVWDNSAATWRTLSLRNVTVLP